MHERRFVKPLEEVKDDEVTDSTDRQFRRYSGRISLQLQIRGLVWSPGWDNTTSSSLGQPEQRRVEEDDSSLACQLRPSASKGNSHIPKGTTTYKRPVVLNPSIAI